MTSVFRIRWLHCCVQGLHYMLGIASQPGHSSKILQINFRSSWSVFPLICLHSFPIYPCRVENIWIWLDYEFPHPHPLRPEALSQATRWSGCKAFSKTSWVWISSLPSNPCLYHTEDWVMDLRFFGNGPLWYTGIRPYILGSESTAAPERALERVVGGGGGGSHTEWVQ